MAEPCSSITAPTLETLIEDCGIVDDGRPLHLLMIGRSGVGKSSLAGVLINGVSEGVDGPDAGTTENIKSTEVRATNESTYIVHDTRGLDGNEEQIQRTIHEIKRIITNEKCIVLVCVRWDDRFANCETTFEVTNQLSLDIWEKSVIALTHSDHLPPTFANLSDDERDEKIEELNKSWKRNIKEKLSCLGVNEDMLDKVKICNTSHTSIPRVGYSKNWLEQLAAEMLKVSSSCNDVANFILAQSATLYPDIVQSLICSFSPVLGTLQNIPPVSFTRISNREIGYGALTTIGGGVSCVGAGAGAGAVLGYLLCNFGFITASVAIGACAGAGIGAGLGLIAGLGIVGVYVLYKLRNKK